MSQKKLCIFVESEITWKRTTECLLFWNPFTHMINNKNAEEQVLENIFSYIHTARPEIMDILSEQQNQYLTSTKRQTSMQEKRWMIRQIVSFDTPSLRVIIRGDSCLFHSSVSGSSWLILKYSTSSLFSSVLRDRGCRLPFFFRVSQSHQSSVEGNQFRALSNPFPCQDFLTSQHFPTYISVYNTWL